MRKLIVGLICVLSAAGLHGADQVPAKWYYENVERVIAVGDVHGAFDSLVAVLQGTGLVNETLAWSGGKAHFVSVGDLVDRGARSRDVMDLLMRLQQEAASAGGRVHVLPGNHEIMNVTGDLRYVAREEYAAFARDENPGERDQAFDMWLAGQTVAADDPEALVRARAQFDELFPPGYFAHRQAFSLTGRYGQWIVSMPFFVRVNDSVFVHGGLPESMSAASPEALNERMRVELRDYLSMTRSLTEAGVFDALADYGERFDLAREALQPRAEARPAQLPDGSNGEDTVPEPEIAPLDPELKAELQAYLALQSGLVFSDNGPLWYRGSVWCHPYWESLRLQSALNNLGGERVAVGHTPTESRTMLSRMDGRVVMMDTGMLAAYYKGRPGALEVSGGNVRVFYADEGRWAAPVAMKRSLGQRPGGMSDDDLETFLLTASIVSSEEIGMGVTKPRRLTLEKDGVQLRAVFKGEDTDTSRGTGTRRDRRLNISDSYRHDVAAYRLDKFLGIDLVPVTVEREYDGATGALQFWVENSVSDLERREQNVLIYPVCDLQELYDLMRVFDVLIYNEDRNQSNVLFDRDNGLVRLIDHSRSFRTHRGRPALYKESSLRVPEKLANRLRALDRDVLHELAGDLLNRKQLRAVLKRRDEILAEAEVLLPGSDVKRVAD